MASETWMGDVEAALAHLRDAIARVDGPNLSDLRKAEAALLQCLADITVRRRQP